MNLASSACRQFIGIHDEHEFALLAFLQHYSSMKANAWPTLWIFLLNVAIFSTFAAAQEKSKPPTFHVHSFDSEMDISKMGGQSVKLHPKDKPSPSLNLAHPVDQMALIRKLGMVSNIKNWDQLEIDRLFMRAQSMPLAEVVALYPSINKAKLQELKQKVSEAKK
jgi:hypothetical protein